MAKKILNLRVKISFKREVALEMMCNTDGLEGKQAACLGGFCITVFLSHGCSPETTS